MGARKIVAKSDDKLNLANIAESRGFKLGLMSVVLAFCLMFMMQLKQPDTLPFKKIQIFGELNWMNKDELNALILTNLDGGFFSLNVDRLKQSLEQQAWIKFAAIRRVWPDVLQVTLTEQQPVAVWNDDSVINKEGELFTPDNHEFPPYLVRMYGPQSAFHNLIAQYQTLVEQTDNIGLKIGSIRLNERRAMQLTLSNGIQILLGRVRDTDDSSAEMQRFIYAYKADLAAKIERVNMVDLRYTNGLAVRWKEPSKSDQQKQTQRAVSGEAVQG